MHLRTYSWTSQSLFLKEGIKPIYSRGTPTCLYPKTKILVEKMFIRSFFIIVSDIQLMDNNENLCSRSSRVPFLCILILPLEVSLLRYEQLLGFWTPFLDSAPFQPSFGFASGFFIHPLKEIAPTLRAF